MQPTLDQLYAEVYQCQILLQAGTERLARLSYLIRQLQAGNELSTGDFLPPPGGAMTVNAGNFPPISGGGNSEADNFRSSNAAAKSIDDNWPDQIGGANMLHNTLPGKTSGANSVAESFHRTTGGAKSTALPTLNQLCRVLKRKAFKKTTGAHISRMAHVMLFIAQHPGETQEIKGYAKMLGMGYAGAAKLMMLARRKGLIVRTAYMVHALTEQGAAYMREALQPVFE